MEWTTRKEFAKLKTEKEFSFNCTINRSGDPLR